MDELMDLIVKMKETLAAKEAFSGVEIGLAYPTVAAKTSPLVPKIILEQGAVTIKGKALGDYLAGDRGKQAKAAVKFTILSPLSEGMQCCAGLFSKLCQALLFDPMFGIVSMTAGSVKLCSDKSAYELTATATLELDLFYRTEEGMDK